MRGGWAPDLWLFDLNTLAARNITNNPANDAQPMWRGDTIYFVSDRGANQRNNIWAEDLRTGAARQITQFLDFDITFPSIGPDAIVFLAGGRLYTLNLATEKTSEVQVRVVTDATTLRAHTAKAEKLATMPSVSPSGKHVAFEARGDIVTVPAERGAVVDVTPSSGVAERYPRWSPDGRTLAYWSDRSGEYELTLCPAESAGTERKVTSLGPGFRYPPQWSPDSRRLAFIDQAMRIRIFDDGTGKVTHVDRSPDWIAHGQLESFRFQWSPDSRWIAYARPASTSNNAIFLFDTKSGQLHQVTSGCLNDTQPVFDPEGKYLYYASDRAFDPIYGTFDNSWTYANPTQIVAVPLRRDVKSPLAARNDAESSAIDTDKHDEKKPDDKAADKPADKPAAPANVDIDVEGFETRAVVLPPKSGAYSDLQTVKGKVLYRRAPRAGSSEEKAPIVYFDLEEREEKTILDDAENRRPHRQLDAVHDRRPAGRCHLPGRRGRSPVPRVGRRTPADRGEGDRRKSWLPLRPEHRHRRAERSDAAIHRAVEKGRPHHRRAMEQRRADSRSLHRAAAPTDRRLLGGTGRAGPAVAAHRASRRAGDAD